MGREREERRKKKKEEERREWRLGVLACWRGAASVVEKKKKKNEFVAIVSGVCII